MSITSCLMGEMQNTDSKRCIQMKESLSNSSVQEWAAGSSRERRLGVAGCAMAPPIAGKFYCTFLMVLVLMLGTWGLVPGLPTPVS